MKIFIQSLLAVTALAFAALPAQACQYGVYDEAPAETTKVIRHRAGFTFQMPTNYRAELRYDNINLLDPDTAQVVDCIARGGGGMGLNGVMSVSHSPARVRSTLWPYDVEHLPQDADFRYFDDGSAMIIWYSDFESARVIWYFENLPNGDGSVMIQYVPIVEHHSNIFSLVERTLEFE
jgi:hypothetical protein